MSFIFAFFTLLAFLVIPFPLNSSQGLVIIIIHYLYASVFLGLFELYA